MLNAKALEEAGRLDAGYRRSGFVGPLHDRTVGGSSRGPAASMAANFATLSVGQEAFAKAVVHWQRRHFARHYAPRRAR